MEEELRGLLEPKPVGHAEDSAESATKVPADEQLLLESDAGSGSPTLKEVFAAMHPDEGLQEVKEWTHGDGPCESCTYMWDVLSEVVGGGDIGVTDDERAAFDEFVAKFSDEERALKVLLALAHDTLC